MSMYVNTASEREEERERDARYPISQAWVQNKRSNTLTQEEEEICLALGVTKPVDLSKKSKASKAEFWFEAPIWWYAICTHSDMIDTDTCTHLGVVKRSSGSWCTLVRAPVWQECVCVCVYVCVYVRVCMPLHVHEYTTHASTHAHARAHEHIYTHAGVRKGTHTHTCRREEGGRHLSYQYKSDEVQLKQV